MRCFVCNSLFGKIFVCGSSSIGTIMLTRPNTAGLEVRCYPSAPRSCLLKGRSVMVGV